MSLKYKLEKRWRSMIWILTVVTMNAIYAVPVYGGCPNCWEEPNPNFDPNNPYSSEPECIEKTTVPCTVSGPPPTGQGDYSSDTKPIGPRDVLDASLGSYGFRRLSGIETYESVEQFSVGEGPVTLYGNCQNPLMDDHTVGSITIPFTISLSLSGSMKKFISVGASTGYTWHFSFGGEPFQLYMDKEDCIHHCASRWIINKKVCATMKGVYHEEAYLAPGNLLYSDDSTAGPVVKCTAEREDKVEWVENSTFCRP